MALAGGVQVTVPHRVGYLHEPGGTDSPDGHTRSFDAQAEGAVFGNGVAMLVLKRLQDALDDGDHIYSVIKGSAVNNDGSGKIAYSAPSINAVAEVVGEALDKAGVPPTSISYVEAHGTATEVGDAIEVAALTKAFEAADTDTGGETQYCAIGSVKSNLGHLVIAAGATALIKTSLSLKHGEIPPNLHYNEPNRRLSFEDSPFFVQKDRARWPANGLPRRAGVNIQGIGGTNVHFILEEPPALEPAAPASRPLHLLVLSANSAPALEAMTDRLAARLGDESLNLEIADVCATLQRGRQVLPHRRFVVCGDRADAVSCLEAREPDRVSSHHEPDGPRQVHFLFSDRGAWQAGMGRDLYDREPVFRSQVDACCRELRPLLGCDLRDFLFPGSEQDEAVRDTAPQDLTQSALFVIEYALARQWMAWGVKPQMMLGEGVGEYVAACLAGVFGLEDALALVVARGRAIADPGDGAALETLRPRIVAALNGAADLPWISAVTGSEIQPEQALDPEYWISQARDPKRFGEDLQTLLAEPRAVFLEVGPGNGHAGKEAARALTEPLELSSLVETPGGGSEFATVLDTLGTLWQRGADIDWEAYHQHERRLRVPLPVYPFEGGNHWVGTRRSAETTRPETANDGGS